MLLVKPHKLLLLPFLLLLLLLLLSLLSLLLLLLPDQLLPLLLLLLLDPPPAVKLDGVALLVPENGSLAHRRLGEVRGFKGAAAERNGSSGCGSRAGCCIF